MRDEESAMKSLRIEYDLESGTIDLLPDASPEAWNEICERYDNDVQRIKTHFPHPFSADFHDLFSFSKEK
jgi:hypothetical protein